MVICPTDQFIKEDGDFHLRLVQGYKEALNGKIVTFGIKPDRPETGYGYVLTKKEPDSDLLEVDSFIEKPRRKGKATDRK